MTAVHGRKYTGRHLLPAFLLALALVLAQTLGLLHRVAHEGAPGAALAAAAAQADPVHGWLTSLFGGHDEQTPECRLFDGLGHGAFADLPVLALPVLPLAQLVARTHADFIARWVTLFDARGPPSSR